MSGRKLLGPTTYISTDPLGLSGLLYGEPLPFLPTLWLSEQTVTFALYIINRLAFITEVESVYCAVRTESLYNIDTSRP